MRRRWDRVVWLLAVSPVVAQSAGCQPTAPAPYGEVFVVVDTDVPVPWTVSTLRVDLYDESGRWFDSRALYRPSPTLDWPASFSVYGTSSSQDSRVVARLRVYPQNLERDYLGEQFAPRPTYVEPPVALTLGELCAQPPDLVLGEELTLRRGPLVVTDPVKQADCGTKPVSSGAVAATLKITQTGVYHIEVTNVVPGEAGVVTDTALLVRRSCSDASTQIACNDDISPSDPLSRVIVSLDPGSYSVVVVGVLGASGGSTVENLGPADLTLRATLATEWSVPQQPAPSTLPDAPRLTIDGTDETPATEPQPAVTVDRLALLHVRPNEQSTAYIVLRGNCAGTMPRLSAAAPYQRLVVNEASTCIDTENVRVPLADEPLLPGVAGVCPDGSACGGGNSLPDHRLEFVAGLACPDASTAPRPDVLCLSGGAMILGEADLSGRGPSDAVPQRLVRMTPFWIDTNEVTVAAWRKAIAAGFETSAGPNANDAPLSTDNPCSWSTTPMGREDYALTCLGQAGARAYCQFSGGDLPTEAQWEYAAADVSYYTLGGSAGAKNVFPWQGPPARNDWCDIAVFGRVPGDVCYSANSTDPAILGSGPLPVTARTMTAATTYAGLIGMGGGVSEFTRDAFESYSSTCWQAASLDNPTCAEQFPPQFSARGGSWRLQGDQLRVASREPLASTFVFIDVGFRCVYAVR